MRNRSSERSDPQRISADLRGQIVRGVFPLGARMPTEDEMCEQFGATRYSVREAMRILTAEGLVARRPRVGTIVAGVKPAERFIQSVPSMRKLLNYPEGTVRKTIGTGYVEASAEVAALLKCRVGERRFRIRALRYPVGSSMPLCYTDIYILPRYATIVNHPNHEFTLVADQLQDVFGERAEKTVIEISASSIKRNIAKLLDVEAGTPALTVTRRYTNAQGEEFETTIAVHPASRYTYAFEFKREP